MRVIRISLALGAGAIGLALSASPALAHVSTNPGQAAAGGYSYHQFRVGHGCESSPTTKVTIFIPDGVVSVKPEIEPGWTAATVKGPITPYDNHGETISEGVKEVSFTASTPLPDDQMTQFGISMKLPEKAGETLWFPVVQTCQQGETRWIDIPVKGQEEPETPAPGIELTAAEGDGHGSTEAKTGTESETAGASTEGEEAAVQTGRVEDDSNTLAIVALMVGAVGLVTGGYSLMALRRRA